MNIVKGQQVSIKPEFQDSGDSSYTWIAVDDSEKGRVTISPIDTGLSIAPQYVT